MMVDLLTLRQAIERGDKDAVRDWDCLTDCTFEESEAVLVKLFAEMTPALGYSANKVAWTLSGCLAAGISFGSPAEKSLVEVFRTWRKLPEWQDEQLDCIRDVAEDFIHIRSIRNT